MKKKLISLLQRKRHIVALSTILMTFIAVSYTHLTLPTNSRV